MRKKLVLIIFLIIFIGFAFDIFARGRPVEVEYPEVEGYKPEEVTTPVPEYVKYIFSFAIWGSGIVALVVLVIAGFQYFTSAGSPEKIKDAKDKISAALLGLAILLGSYLILTTINPELVVFHLKRLRPLISTLPQGVLVCKEEIDVDQAWQLENNFKYAQEYWEQKMIKEELDVILDKVALKCYSILGSGDIIPGFNNQITDIYFIHGEQKIDEKTYLAAYGAILYEETNYEGKSQPIYEHLEPGRLGGVVRPTHIEHKALLVNPSSIKPFVLIPKHQVEAFQVGLFQQYNRNQGLSPEIRNKWYRLDPDEPYTDTNGNGQWDPDEPYTDTNGNGQWDRCRWYYKWDVAGGGFCSLPEAICGTGFASPRSIQVGNNFLAILLTPDERSDTFYNEIDNNLDDNLNIVNRVVCKDYHMIQLPPGAFGGGYETRCAQPAVKDLIIISAKVF